MQVCGRNCWNSGLVKFCTTIFLSRAKSAIRTSKMPKSHYTTVITAFTRSSPLLERYGSHYTAPIRAGAVGRWPWADPIRGGKLLNKQLIRFKWHDLSPAKIFIWSACNSKSGTFRVPAKSPVLRRLYTRICPDLPPSEIHLPRCLLYDPLVQARIQRKLRAHIGPVGEVIVLVYCNLAWGIA